MGFHVQGTSTVGWFTTFVAYLVSLNMYTSANFVALNLTATSLSLSELYSLFTAAGLIWKAYGPETQNSNNFLIPMKASLWHVICRHRTWNDCFATGWLQGMWTWAGKLSHKSCKLLDCLNLLYCFQRGLRFLFQCLCWGTGRVLLDIELCRRN